MILASPTLVRIVREVRDTATANHVRYSTSARNREDTPPREGLFARKGVRVDLHGSYELESDAFKDRP
jgi:hypothetical protein